MLNTLQNITFSLNNYFEKVKGIYVPDVLELQSEYGIGHNMGRAVFTTDIAGTYFNKSKVHKKYKSYIGHPHPEFYQQEIVEIEWEKRIFVVKEIPNSDDVRIIQFAHTLKRSFSHQLTDYILDVYKKPNDGNLYIMELNEIHKGSMTPEEFQYVLSMVVI
jgi:hypothetical protein